MSPAPQALNSKTLEQSPRSWESRATDEQPTRVPPWHWHRRLDTQRDPTNKTLLAFLVLLLSALGKLLLQVSVFFLYQLLLLLLLPLLVVVSNSTATTAATTTTTTTTA